jgi:hypothetical protein
LEQADEALPVLQELARGVTENPNDRWSLLAACELWLHHLKQRQLEEADEVFQLLESHYRFEQLAGLVSDELRRQILDLYRQAYRARLQIRRDPRLAAKLRRVLDVETLFQAPVQERVLSAHQLILCHLLHDQLDDAVRTAEEALHQPDLADYHATVLLTDMLWALRGRGEADRALAELDQRLAAGQRLRSLPYALLLLERARLRASRKEWAAAEKDVADYFQFVHSGRWQHAPLLLAEGHLVSGFLRDAQGDRAGAEKAWREGARLLKGTAALVSEEGTAARRPRRTSGGPQPG